MLTAYQIDALRDKSTQLLDPVIDFLIEDITRRISEAGQLTGTASYQVWRAQNLGLSQKKLKKEIQKRLNISMEEVEKLLTQAAKTGYNFDISRFPNKRAVPFEANSSIQQIVDAAVKLAKEDLTNITQTLGFVSANGEAMGLTDAYNSACDFAFTKVATGAQDFHSALRDATRGLAEKGILSIDYESGVHTSLEAAVRRNIMGGLGLMQEQISQQNHDDLGCDGWEISAHAGSAPDHEPIQGKQYPDKVYQKLNGSLNRRIGTLNCGHAASPIIMGVNEPQYTPEELERFRQENEEGVTVDGKHYTKYEATQHQRGLERAARKQKRRILIDETAGDTEKLQQDQIKLVRIRQEYKRFSDAAGLRMQHERMDTAGFTWKHGKAAETAAKRAESVAKQSTYATDDTSKKTSESKGVQKTYREKETKATATIGSNLPKTPISIWDNDRGTESWKEDRKKQIISVEHNSVLSPVEIGILYDADGKRVLRKKGDCGSVEFTPSQIKQMRGGVLTHNHPGADYGCFSPADIDMLRESHLAEIRVATPIGVFSMQRPAKWPSSINGLEKIRKVYYDIDSSVGSEYWARVYRGEMSIMDAENLGQRAVVEEMCKRYGIPFKFDSWEDLGRKSYENLL